MIINDDFALNDVAIGLKLIVQPGESMDCLRIESDSFAREFWFNKDGSFDGTGSDLRGQGLEMPSGFSEMILRNGGREFKVSDDGEFIETARSRRVEP